MTRHLLKTLEKDRIFKILEDIEIDVSSFSWAERRIGLRRFTVLLCQPRRYYFVFDKNGDKVIARTFFPCWKQLGIENNVGSGEALVAQLDLWIDSIDRIRRRQRQLFVSVEEGAVKRRSFARIAETLKTGDSRKTS